MAALPKKIEISVLDIEISKRVLREQERKLMVQGIHIDELNSRLQSCEDENGALRTALKNVVGLSDFEYMPCEIQEEIFRALDFEEPTEYGQ